MEVDPQQALKCKEDAPGNCGYIVQEIITAAGEINPQDSEM